MTRLLLLSVQRILKNLNEIRGKVLHSSERPLDAIHQIRQNLNLLRWCRGWKQYQRGKKCEGIVHIVEGTPYEQYRSMRRGGDQARQFMLHTHIVRTD